MEVYGSVWKCVCEGDNVEPHTRRRAKARTKHGGKWIKGRKVCISFKTVTRIYQDGVFGVGCDYMSECSMGIHRSSWWRSLWYRNSMVPLWMKVHTLRGPTPRNHPAMPSVRYMRRRPVKTEEVSSGMAPGRGRCVFGDEVEMCRI